MKILMLTPYLPYPLLTGGQTRSYNLIRRMAKKGHQITLFCLVKSDSERKNVWELEKYCQKVQVFNRPGRPWTIGSVLKTGFSLFPFLVIRNWADGEKVALSKELANQHYDLIHAETFYVMPHIPKTSVPILLVEQTIEFLVYKHFADENRFWFLKPLLYIDVAKMKYWELTYWSRAKKVVAMSKEDKKIMLSQNSKLDVDIVPNGVDTNHFGEMVFSRLKEPIILYVGNFTWLQNREAVDVLFRRVWPKVKQQIVGAKLWIIGKDARKFFTHLRSNDVRIDEVGDIREAYQQASVLVAPIYGGGGTRYKNFEAFASGLPVITTSIGIGGTDAQDGEEIIIRDKPDEIAKETIKLLQSTKLRQKLSANAKLMVRERYDWESVAYGLNRLYQEVGGG